MLHAPRPALARRALCGGEVVGRAGARPPTRLVRVRRPLPTSNLTAMSSKANNGEGQVQGPKWGRGTLIGTHKRLWK